MVVAQGQQLAQLQEVLDKVLTRVAVLERELDETKKAQELTQSALRRILEAEDEERKRKKQKTYQAGETKNKIQVSFLLRHERNLTAARHVGLDPSDREGAAWHRPCRPCVEEAREDLASPSPGGRIRGDAARLGRPQSPPGLGRRPSKPHQ